MMDDDIQLNSAIIVDVEWLDETSGELSDANKDET